jgi:hypothetical protein
MTLSRSPRVAVAPCRERDREPGLPPPENLPPARQQQEASTQDGHRPFLCPASTRALQPKLADHAMTELYVTRTNSPLMLRVTRGGHAVSVARFKGDQALHSRRLRFFTLQCLPRVLVPPDYQAVDRFDVASASGRRPGHESRHSRRAERKDVDVASTLDHGGWKPHISYTHERPIFGHDYRQEGRGGDRVHGRFIHRPYY